MKPTSFVWLLVLCTVLSAPGFAQQPVAFVHVNVIAMDRDGVLADRTVLVEDGKIVSIVPSAEAKLGSKVLRIDASGRYLIPGLTDAHVHLQTPVEFPLYLANGVTTVFNLAGRPAHLAWRKQIEAGTMLGPNIVTTGPVFDRPHSAEEAVRMVDEQAALGYDAVKIYNQVSKEEYPALIAEAKRKKLLLMGHVARKPDFELTLQSGQSIAHLEEYTYTFFNPQRDDRNRHIVYDESRIPKAVRLSAQAGIYVTPTLSTYASIVQQATALDEFLKDPNLKYDSPWIRDGFEPASNRYKNGFSPEDYPRIRASLALQRKLVKALAEGGVPLMAGTDASDVGPVAGYGIHDELQELVNDGLSPFQALQTATANPARYFGKAQESGTIEVGKRADLVLLEGNPLADISNTRKVAGVVVRGRWVERQELEKLVDAVPSEYARSIREAKQLLETDADKALGYLDARDPFDNLAAAAMAGIIQEKGVGKFREAVGEVRRRNSKSRLASEEMINNFGYTLLGQKKYPEAIAVLRMNTEDFPASANTWDSLADGQAQSGDMEHAVENYKKALETDPKYGNADGARKFLDGHTAK
jgi:imidazolonepropionase-like amidohydrolase